MKGGAFTLSESFMKIISTGYVAVVLLAIFFAVNEYNLIYMDNRGDRETLVVGDAVLSSCIAENYNGYAVKGLLSEAKIQQKIIANPSRNSNIDCLNYNKGIFIEVYDENNILLQEFGNSTVCTSRYPCVTKSFVSFPVALNRTTSIIIPVNVFVYLGDTL